MLAWARGKSLDYTASQCPCLSKLTPGARALANLSVVAFEEIYQKSYSFVLKCGYPLLKKKERKKQKAITQNNLSVTLSFAPCSLTTPTCTLVLWLCGAGAGGPQCPEAECQPLRVRPDAAGCTMGCGGLLSRFGFCKE